MPAALIRTYPPLASTALVFWPLLFCSALFAAPMSPTIDCCWDLIMPAILDCVCVAAWGRRVVLSVVGLPGEASKVSSISLERTISSDCDDASLDNKAPG